MVDQKIIFSDKVLPFMKIKRDCVLSYLQEKEERSGGVKSHILFDLQDTREVRGEKAISPSTFYRQAKQTVLNEYFSGYDWFNVKNIRISPQYSVKEARDSLSTIFSFSGLKTFGGADLSAIYWGRKIRNLFLEVLTS